MENQNIDDEEKFEDANEKIVDDLITKTSGIELTPKRLKEQTENEKFEDCLEDPDEDEKTEDNQKEDDFIDDDLQKDLEKDLTDEQRQENTEKAIDLKREGNELFKKGEYENSVAIYTNALRTCPVESSNERSILYANRAAAKSKLDMKSSAIDDCTKALEFNPSYLKALLRRANLYEETDKLDESLLDFKKVTELDQENNEARSALIRLPPKINERNEKLKTEMMGKLKDLGNLILKPFGLSTNNFQMTQDPGTGSYSINFKQNNP